jgi:hypothetical protein
MLKFLKPQWMYLFFNQNLKVFAVKDASVFQLNAVLAWITFSLHTIYKLNDHQLESYVHDEWDRADQSFETIDKICIALNGEVEIY